MKKEIKDFSRPMQLTLKAAIVKPDHKVLLLKRDKNDLFNKSKWDLPGGKLEAGETISEGLRREIKEETDLDVEMGKLIDYSELPKEHKHFMNEKRGLRFIVKYQGGEVKINPKEHSEFVWLPIDEAIEKMDEKDQFENEKREVLVAAKKYLEMEESEERWKRALADLDNYKKRSAKSNEEFRKYCLEDFILELLPVIDNFEMAIEHTPQENKNDNWMTGILHIQKQLENVLNEKGVGKIPVKIGDKIDENIHEVISGKSKKGKIRKVLKSGYKIGERVIRAASVESE